MGVLLIGQFFIAARSDFLDLKKHFESVMKFRYVSINPTRSYNLKLEY